MHGRTTLGSIDLDTTLPLTTAAFWQFAHSQDFYRSTRQQTSTVRQEVREGIVAKNTTKKRSRSSNIRMDRRRGGGAGAELGRYI